MIKGVSDKITYKPYNQDERWLLPPSLGELIPESHLVRVASKTVDEMDIEKIFRAPLKTEVFRGALQQERKRRGSEPLQS